MINANKKVVIENTKNKYFLILFLLQFKDTRK